MDENEDEAARRRRMAHEASSYLPRIEIEAMLRSWKEGIERDRSHDIAELRYELQGYVRQEVDEFVSRDDIDKRNGRRWFNVGLPVSPDPDSPGEPEERIKALFEYVRAQQRRSAGQAGMLGKVLGWGAAVATIGTAVGVFVTYVISHITVGMR